VAADIVELEKVMDVCMAISWSWGMSLCTVAVDMNLCQTLLGLDRRYQSPDEVASAPSNRDALADLYLEHGQLGCGGRLQPSNDLSSMDSNQISPCNPRRHWGKMVSALSEGAEKEEQEQVDEEVDGGEKSLREMAWVSPWVSAAWQMNAPP
jgi:hypothetical protein